MNYNEDYEKALQYSQHDRLTPTSDITGLTDALIADPSHEGKKMALADAMMEHGHPAYQRLGEILTNSAHVDTKYRDSVNHTTYEHFVKSATNTPEVFSGNYTPTHSHLSVEVPGTTKKNLLIQAVYPHKDIEEHLTNLLGFIHADKYLKEHKEINPVKKPQDYYSM